MSHAQQAREHAAILRHVLEGRSVAAIPPGFSCPAKLAGELRGARSAGRDVPRWEHWYADEAPGDWIDACAKQGTATGVTFRESARLSAHEQSFAEV